MSPADAQFRVEDGHVGLAGPGRVFVRRWRPEGASDAPVFLLHDSLGCVDLWRDFPARLAQRLRREVIAYDRPGFGRSDPRDERPSLDFIAEESTTTFAALRDALGVERFAVFGHSVGGAMALGVAAAFPDQCVAVVSESAQAFDEERTLEGIRQAQAGFADPERFDRLRRWHGDKAQWVLDAWTGVWLDPMFSDWSLDAVLPNVKCPALVMHGDRDEYGSLAFPERIAAGVGGTVDTCVFEGCGHVPHRERPDAVLDRVAALLA